MSTEPSMIGFAVGDRIRLTHNDAVTGSIKSFYEHREGNRLWTLAEIDWDEHVHPDRAGPETGLASFQMVKLGLPNHCQECGVWGSQEAHLRTCSKYQREYPQAPKTDYPISPERLVAEMRRRANFPQGTPDRAFLISIRYLFNQAADTIERLQRGR